MNNQTNSVEVRESEINRVMNDLSKAVECLTQSVETTEARLAGITRNSNPPELKEVSDTPYETNLAQDINKIHNKIQGLRKRLDDLLDRIEL